MSNITTKKASYTAVITAEFRLLNALVKDSKYLDDPRVSEELFVDETAKSLFEAINNLRDVQADITPASLLQAGSEIDFNVNQQVVQTIFDIEEEAPSTLDDIIPALKTAQLKSKLLDKIDRIKTSLTKPGELDTDNILGDLYDVDETITNQSKNTSPLLDFETWSDLYIEDLEARRAGRKYSYGDILLDENLFKGAYPGAITIVAASTNMGKSTYVLSLINNLLERNQPCMYISLEMGTVDTFDRLIAQRCGIDNETLYDADPNNIDTLISIVKRERDDLLNRKKFYFCEDTDVDLNKLRSLIREFKQRSKSDYCFVAIDLLTQMKNFMNSSNGSSTATAMEIGMNKLNALAKEENVHILGVVQFKRDSDSAHIHSVEEIEYLRPNLADIKNSGAIAERARVVLSVFRPRYYADRYLRNDPTVDNMEDIMEVQVLKNSSGSAGKVFKYMFDSAHFKLLPITNEEDEKMNKLKELDIDY